MLFPVYARADSERVRLVVDALRQVGIDVWMETDNLTPGSKFENQIEEAIKHATAALVFISRAMVTSTWAHFGLRVLREEGTPIIPLVLERVPELPPRVDVFLSPLQQIDLTGYRSAIPPEAVEQIRNALAHARPRPVFPIPPKVAEDIRKVADRLADDVRKPPPASVATASPPKSVFIVHGHDDQLLKLVEGHLARLGVESVVLRRIGGPAQSLLQKFMQWGSETRFALVLLSADDLGASRTQYDADGVGTHALQFRARQNVVLELGFFYGHLGWENVFVLFKEPDKVFPNFEMPSDLGGVVFDRVDESGEWKAYLEQKLKEAGFEIG